MNNIMMSHTVLSDSYKFSQYAQYRPNTESIFSYIEFRGSDRFDKSVFFGLSAFLQKYMTTPITLEEIDYAEELITSHGEPFNRSGWEYILNKHNGYLPLRIKAAPEGSVIPLGNVLVTVENTDPECYWLTSFKETVLLPAVWYPSAVATISYHIREICKKYLDRTSDTADTDIGFMLNDFGFRGVSSTESAALGGLAHLSVFSGTDNIAALIYARMFYKEKMAGFSIPAMEHSTVTSWGKDGEFNSFENMINQYAKNKIFACVIDSYDTYEAIKTHWLAGGLLDKVKAAGARVVLRPDSGDPTVVPVEVITLLMDGLAGDVKVNSKGYKVLPDYVRVIQGDGITQENIETILSKLEVLGFSASNIVFGLGGKLLQAGVDRDMMQAAMKCSSTTFNGETIDVYKQPKTDDKKKSKKGIITLVMEDGVYKTIRLKDKTDSQQEVLQLVYENGKLFNIPSLAEVRERISHNLS